MTKARRRGDPLDKLATVLGWLCCAVCLLMMLHIVADIAAKYVFNAPLFGTIEIVSGYYMVMLVFLPLALVAHKEGHIFVELFTRKLSRRATARLDALAIVVTVLVIGLMLWVTVDEAARRSVQGEVWEVSGSSMIIWPSRWFPPIGCALMIVYTVARLAARRR